MDWRWHHLVWSSAVQEPWTPTKWNSLSTGSLYIHIKKKNLKLIAHEWISVLCQSLDRTAVTNAISTQPDECSVNTSLTNIFSSLRQAPSQVLRFGGAIYILRGNNFRFYYMCTTNFLGTTKFEGEQNIGGNCPGYRSDLRFLPGLVQCVFKISICSNFKLLVMSCQTPIQTCFVWRLSESGQSKIKQNTKQTNTSVNSSTISIAFVHVFLL